MSKKPSKNAQICQFLSLKSILQPKEQISALGVVSTKGFVRSPWVFMKIWYFWVI
jgi:hypothetical protein